MRYMNVSLGVQCCHDDLNFHPQPLITARIGVFDMQVSCQ